MQFRSVVSLKDEFALYAKVARDLASRLPPGPERDHLIRRARRAEATFQLQDLTNSLGIHRTRPTVARISRATRSSGSLRLSR